MILGAQDQAIPNEGGSGQGHFVEVNIEKLLIAVEKDAENIRALARIAEIHERRLSDLEGGERKN